MKAFKAFIKPYEVPQSVKKNVQVNFYVNTTFWYETLVQLSKLTLKAKVTEIFSHLTGVFLDDWLKCTGQKLDWLKYFHTLPEYF